MNYYFIQNLYVTVYKIETIKKYWLLCFIGAISCSNIHNIHAQDSLSYDQLVQMMLVKNPSLNSAKQNLEAAINDLLLVKATRLPDLNGVVSNALNDGRSLDPITYQYTQQDFFSNVYRLQSSMNLFQGGKTNISIDKFKLAVDIQNLNIENQSVLLHKTLFEQYAESFMLSELSQLCKEKIALLYKVKAIATLHVEAGRKTNASLANIEIELNKLSQYLEDINFRYEVSLLKIRNLIGHPLKSPLNITSTQALSPDSLIYQHDQLEKIASNSSAYKLACTKTLLYIKDIKLTKSYRYPSIVLGVALGSGYSSILKNNALIESNWESQMNNNYYQTLSLNLNIPIFNRFQNSISIKKSKIVHAQSIENEKKEYAEVLQLLNTLKLQSNNFYNNYRLGLSSLTYYNKVMNESFNNYTLGRLETWDYLMQMQQKFLLQENIIVSKYNCLIAQKTIQIFETGSVKLN